MSASLTALALSRNLITVAEALEQAGVVSLADLHRRAERERQSYRRAA